MKLKPTSLLVLSTLLVGSAAMAQTQVAEPDYTHPSNETRIKNLKAYLPTAIKLAKKYNAQ